MLIGSLVVEEVVKDLVIPYFIGQEIVAGTSAVIGTGIALVEESKD
jgi:hypothetical protein